MTLQKELELAKAIAQEAYPTPQMANQVTQDAVDLIKENYTHLRLQSIAWLRDVIQRRGLTEQDLINRGISETTAYNVQILTRKEGQSYNDYLLDIKTEPLAKLVKLADLLTKLANNPIPRIANVF